jgi:hypothetical protein
MHIKVNSEEELKEIAATLLHISVNLRHWQQKWHEEHGSRALERRHYWENKLDDYLAQLGAGKVFHKGDIHISVKSE